MRLQFGADGFNGTAVGCSLDVLADLLIALQADLAGPDSDIVPKRGLKRPLQKLLVLSVRQLHGCLSLLHPRDVKLRMLIPQQEELRFQVVECMAQMQYFNALALQFCHFFPEV